MDISKYKCLIQKDGIGDLIDIYNIEDDTSLIEEGCIVLSMKEAKEYAKKHPNKKFFTYGLEKEIIDYINS